MGYRPISLNFQLLQQQPVDMVQFIWHDFSRIPSHSISFISIYLFIYLFLFLSLRLLVRPFCQSSVLRGCPLTNAITLLPVMAVDEEVERQKKTDIWRWKEKE